MLRHVHACLWVRTLSGLLHRISPAARRQQGRETPPGSHAAHRGEQEAWAARRRPLADFCSVSKVEWRCFECSLVDSHRSPGLCQG